MNLDRELLFRFFNKETTLEEEKKIRLWIDECDEHRCEFFRERQLFDAILLHGDPSYEKSRPRFYIPWHKVVATLSGIAAIVILTIITTTYFLQQSFRDEVMNTVTVPQGQRVHLTLSDGTKVWLNAKTKMEYPQSFKVSDQRIVKVDGEAYFEVSKNKEKPFIVKTTKGDVEVLGTKFYISAYATTDVFETSLMVCRVLYRVLSWYVIVYVCCDFVPSSYIEPDIIGRIAESEKRVSDAVNLVLGKAYV